MLNLILNNMLSQSLASQGRGSGPVRNTELEEQVRTGGQGKGHRNGCAPREAGIERKVLGAPRVKRNVGNET
jgi:hypothetical protein